MDAAARSGATDGGALAPAGAWLGPWEVLGPLGRGGFAEVVRARRADTGAEAALKVARDVERVRPDPALPPHPHVVRVLEAGLDHDPPWVALELAAGGSLRGALRAGRVPPAVAARVVAEVAAALDHAHAHGALHLDVKPENVLLDGPLPAGRARLADFGVRRAAPRVAHSLVRSGEDEAVARTRDYAAPEVLEGGVVDRRADVWGLGALAFELLAGRRPVGLDRPTDLAPELPPAVDAVVARALSRDPARRPVSAGALARELAAALAPGPAVPAGGAPRGRPVAPALLLVGALGVLGAALLPRPRPALAPRGPVAAAPDTGDAAGAALAALLAAAPGRVLVLPVDDLGDADGGARAAAARAHLAAAVVAAGRGAEVVAPEVPDPGALHGRAGREALARAAHAELALTVVLPPGGDAADPHLTLVDLAAWRVVAATPPRLPALQDLGRRVAGWAEAAGGREQVLALLPVEDAGLGTSGRTAAALDAELLAAVVAARTPRLVVRPAFGRLERLRAGGASREALGARLVLEAFIDAPGAPGADGAPGPSLLVRLRDLDAGEVRGAATVPLSLSAPYDPGLDAAARTVDPRAVARLVDARLAEARGAAAERQARRARLRAEALLAAGRPGEALASLEEALAGAAPEAPRVELLLLLGRAAAAAGAPERAVEPLARAACGLGDLDPRPRAALADLVLEAAARRYARGKRAWWEDDDEGEFEAARGLLRRLDGLPLDPPRAAAAAALARRVDGEL